MARSAVRTFNANFANVQGADAVQRILASLPDAITGPVQDAINQGGDDLAAQAKAIAPVAPEFETHPGQMRESIRREDNGRALSTTVVCDARDKDGKPYPAHVEYGHRTKAGRHVPAKPFFWPSYRVAKKRIRSRISRAINKGVKSVAGSAAT